MIWEKNILTLVMLTRCNEQGRVSMQQLLLQLSFHPKGYDLYVLWTLKTFSTG